MNPPVDGKTGKSQKLPLVCTHLWILSQSYKDLLTVSGSGRRLSSPVHFPGPSTSTTTFIKHVIYLFTNFLDSSLTDEIYL